VDVNFWLSLAFEPYEQLLDHARMAEELGFEGVILPDHVAVPEGGRAMHPGGYPLRPVDPFPDPLIAFGAMCAVTTRLRFLSKVLVVPLRNPLLLAKQIGTLALLSDNRFVLGTGVGWLKEEFESADQRWEQRGARMDEMLDILVAFWTEGYAEYHGQHYDFARGGMFPVPTAPIPIWIGGSSLAAARRAARFDGYAPMTMGEMDDETREQFALIDDLRAQEGRAGAFSRLVPWMGGNDPSMVGQLRDSDSITDFDVSPWQLGLPTPPSSLGDQTIEYGGRDLPFSAKRTAAEAFANAVIRAS